MVILFAELLIIILMIFALVILIRSYMGLRRRIKELEKELRWYRRAAMARKLDPYPDDMK